MCGVLDLVLAFQTADPGSLPRIDDSVPSRVRVNSRILYALSTNRDIDNITINTQSGLDITSPHKGIVVLLEKELPPCC